MGNGERRGRLRVFRNARLADGRCADISVEVSEGTVESVTPAGSIGGAANAASRSHGAGGRRLDSGDCDLEGALLLPAMAEPHAHLDKALTADVVPNPTGDLDGAILGWRSASRTGLLSYEGTVARATRALEKLLVHGATSIRTHVNATGAAGVSGVRAVREAARSFEGLIDVQVVALTGSPMTGADGADNRKALEAAVEEGVDLVGGCPHLEPDALAHISSVLAVASAADIDVDLHVDETLDASVLTLRELARLVVSTGFAGRVTASHCVSLGVQELSAQAAVAAEVASAGISVVTLPQTNLFLQGRGDPVATPRGLTAVGVLREAGVVVAAGGDNVQDPFNPMGRSDPLETAALLVTAGHMLPQTAFDMVSSTARRVMGSAPANFEPGDRADFVAIAADSLRSAIAEAPMSRRVYRGGVLVASACEHVAVHRPGRAEPGPAALESPAQRSSGPGSEDR